MTTVGEDDISLKSTVVVRGLAATWRCYAFNGRTKWTLTMIYSWWQHHKRYQILDININYTWQKELRSQWSNNLEQSSGRSATPLAVTAVIWTKTETVFVWAMSASEEFCLSRGIQMFALLLFFIPSGVKIPRVKSKVESKRKAEVVTPRRQRNCCGARWS